MRDWVADSAVVHLGGSSLAVQEVTICLKGGTLVNDLQNMEIISEMGHSAIRILLHGAERYR